MGADIFESYVGAIVAAIALAATGPAIDATSRMQRRRAAAAWPMAGLRRLGPRHRLRSGCWRAGSRPPRCAIVSLLVGGGLFLVDGMVPGAHDFPIEADGRRVYAVSPGPFWPGPWPASSSAW